ncbi:hypothetical protein PISMIDRAFT_685131 [Pisolithus microcarpus 441]|uniref:Uncharacterized protein n=1 Tax=Pisolithus microcarpus 441 TaxID=765257 RepID=A0A0C9Z539_9AGAM|nr:hypothetical protein PISMIDRAFT_685131 [Pisolithus microcarpus 441]
MTSIRVLSLNNEFTSSGSEQQSTSQSTRLHQAGRKGEDPVAFATFADIEAPSAFDLRSGFKSDPWTECRSE